jgi:hypothetical protein
MSSRTEIPIREASDPPDDVDIWQRWTVGIGHGQPRRGADADFRYGVKPGNTRWEQMFSGLPPTTDIERPRRHVRLVCHEQTSRIRIAPKKKPPKGGSQFIKKDFSIRSPRKKLKG